MSRTSSPQRKRRYHLMLSASSWAPNHKNQLEGSGWKSYRTDENRALAEGDYPSRSVVDSQERALKALDA